MQFVPNGSFRMLELFMCGLYCHSHLHLDNKVSKWQGPLQSHLENTLYPPHCNKSDCIESLTSHHRDQDEATIWVYKMKSFFVRTRDISLHNLGFRKLSFIWQLVVNGLVTSKTLRSLMITWKHSDTLIMLVRVLASSPQGNHHFSGFYICEAAKLKSTCLISKMTCTQLIAFCLRTCELRWDTQGGTFCLVQLVVNSEKRYDAI